MTKLFVTQDSMERCLMDMPYEILFEIFRRLPKGKLMGVSRLCSKLRDVAGDKRLWKNVYIKYNPYEEPTYEMFAFEELYSQLLPVKVIDLLRTKIIPPVSMQIDQVVRVTELKLSSINAAYKKCTMEAILAKYQCTKLFLEFFFRIGFENDITDIAPETFLKQSAVEVLKVKNQKASLIERQKIAIWLAQVLSNCKNLKILDLSYTYFRHSEMMSLVKNMPKSLEKILLQGVYPEDCFFETLAGVSRNLKELGMSCITKLLPSLLKFQFLETLRITLYHYINNIDPVYMYLIKFPALKTVYVDIQIFSLWENRPQTDYQVMVEELREKLEPHGIKTEIVERNEVGPEFDANDCNCWLVSKAV